MYKRLRGGSNAGTNSDITNRERKLFLIFFFYIPVLYLYSPFFFLFAPMDFLAEYERDKRKWKLGKTTGKQTKDHEEEGEVEGGVESGGGNRRYNRMKAKEKMDFGRKVMISEE